MDDIIFEKDYRETESVEYDKWCDEVFDRAVNGGMLKAYSEAMDKIPKIIVYQGNVGLSSLARGNQYVSSVCGVR